MPDTCLLQGLLDAAPQDKIEPPPVVSGTGAPSSNGAAAHLNGNSNGNGNGTGNGASMNGTHTNGAATNGANGAHSNDAAVQVRCPRFSCIACILCIVQAQQPPSWRRGHHVMRTARSGVGLLHSIAGCARVRQEQVVD